MNPNWIGLFMRGWRLFYALVWCLAFIVMWVIWSLRGAIRWLAGFQY